MHRSTIRFPYSSILSFIHVYLLFCAVVFMAGCQATNFTPSTTLSNENDSNPLHGNDTGKSLKNIETYRGLFIWGHEVRSFSLCGSSEELWVIDKTNGDAKAIHTILTNKPYQPIFVEIKGIRGNAPKDGFGADYSGAIVFEELIHASKVEESWACREKYSEFIFKAQGNEPGWTIFITKSGIRFSSINHEKPFDFPLVKPTRHGTISIYSTQHDNHSLKLVINRTRCSDTMSDEMFGWKAEATLDGTLYSGCAKRGDQK